MLEFEGKLHAPEGTRIGIVVGRFNEVSTKGLLEGCLNGLQRCGVEEGRITVAWVPGAVEIPLIARKLAHSGQFDAIICLGCVMQGGTKHFDYVAGQASSGIGQLNLDCDLPVVFGVLTVETVEQAVERSGGRAGNKGFEAALTAVEMIDLLKQLQMINADHWATASV